MIASKVIFIDYFYIYSVLGWLVESIYCSLFAKPKPHWINRGFLYGPYCPIYGVGALMVLLVLWPLRNLPMVVFIASMVLTSILEYFTSYILEKLFHTRWWDYSSKRFNLRGRICLKNSLLFGVMGLVLVYIIHPLIQESVMKVDMMVLTIIVLIVTFGFTFDLAITFNTLIQRNHVLEHISEELDQINIKIKADNQFLLDQFNVMINSDPRYEMIRQRLRSFYAISNARILSHIHAAYPTARFKLDFKNQIKKSVESLKKWH